MDILNIPTRIPLNWKAHRSLFMYNYFSIGVDAQVALNFHKARQSPLYIFSSRVINKVKYIHHQTGIVRNFTSIPFFFRHFIYALVPIK